ncbi:MAG: prolipoprotein diacylglyceryl transferase [Planctomycetota bacterium]|jgi:phosphatidylglycerol:prolipoprotein diacylglycerol transferase|nr:prolipoprotein diacylglyceryl transferase [Planctomycetota bacterium]
MHRILFVIPVGNGIPVFGYGLFLMLGFVAGLGIACVRGKRMGLTRDSVLDVGLLSIFFGVVGARLCYLLVDYSPEEGQGGFWEWIAVWRGGLTFQGGLALAILSVWIYLKARKISIGRMFDAYAPGIAVGVGFGRIGCLMNGCCWGETAPASFSLGMTFPENIEPMAYQFRLAEQWSEYWADLLATLGYPPGTPPPLPLYPTQIVSAIGLFLIALLLVWMEKRFRRRDGQVMLWFVFLYSIGRFAIEFWRADTPLRYGFGAFPGLRLGQWLAVGMFALGIAFQLLLNRSQGNLDRAERQERE